MKPQHFLPVHGEYAFLTEHAELAQEAGIRSTSVIRNGQMLGVASRRNGKTLSTGSMAHLGTASLQLLYNDGNNVSAMTTWQQSITPQASTVFMPLTSSAENVHIPWLR